MPFPQSAQLAAGGNPSLRSFVEVFPTPDGDLYLLSPLLEEGLAVAAPDDSTRQLLTSLDGTRTVDKLVSTPSKRSRDEVVEALDRLRGAGLLASTPARPSRLLTAEAGERYSRQLVYFSDFAPDAEVLQRRLSTARVVIIGLGGLGSWTLAGLACTGIGSVVAYDDDDVELSNLNRQVIYRRADVGRPKVEAAREFVSSFDPSLQFEAHRERIDNAEAARRAVDGADLVITTGDWPAYDLVRWVNRACVGAGVAHIGASQIPPMIRVGPMYIPASRGCHECAEWAARAAFPYYDQLEEFRKADQRPAATLGPASGLIGNLLANEAMHYLAGLCAPATSGKSLTMNLQTLETTLEVAPVDADCPVCAAP